MALDAEADGREEVRRYVEIGVGVAERAFLIEIDLLLKPLRTKNLRQESLNPET